MMTRDMMMKECVMWRLTKRYEAAMEGSELQKAENEALKTEVRALKMRVNESTDCLAEQMSESREYLQAEIDALRAKLRLRQQKHQELKDKVKFVLDHNMIDWTKYPGLKHEMLMSKYDK